MSPGQIATVAFGAGLLVGFGIGWWFVGLTIIRRQLHSLGDQAERLARQDFSNT